MTVKPLRYVGERISMTGNNYFLQGARNYEKLYRAWKKKDRLDFKRRAEEGSKWREKVSEEVLGPAVSSQTQLTWRDAQCQVSLFAVRTVQLETFIIWNVSLCGLEWLTVVFYYVLPLNVVAEYRQGCNEHVGNHYINVSEKWCLDYCLRKFKYANTIREPWTRGKESRSVWTV